MPKTKYTLLIYNVHNIATLFAIHLEFPQSSMLVQEMMAVVTD